MRTALFIISCFSVLVQTASATQCLSLFSLESSFSKELTKEIQKVEALNPELIQRFNKTKQRPTDLYLILKKEAWTFLPLGMLPWKNKPTIPEAVVRNIENFPSKSYDTKNLTPDQTYMFYVNALQGLYISIARLIRTEFLSSILTSQHRPTQTFMELLFDKLLFVDLGRMELAPERALEALKELEQLDFPWLVFQKLAHRHFEEGKQQDVKVWFSEQAEYKLLSSEQITLFVDLIYKKKNPKQHCCLNRPGCLFCPNNRSFLIQKE